MSDNKTDARAVGRLRILPDPDFPAVEWCARGGDVAWRPRWAGPDGVFMPRMAYHRPDEPIQRNMMTWPSPERVALWADLIAHPTEEVTE